MENRWRAKDASTFFLRLALASSFLSAVADCFGLWGKFGQPHVTWGDFSHFVAYSEQLTAIVPISFGPVLAWTATIAEVLLGLALIVGLKTRIASLLSGALLLLFGLAMAFALGIKAPLDFSVFSAAGSAFLLSNCDRYRISIDDWACRESSWTITRTARPSPHR